MTDFGSGGTSTVSVNAAILKFSSTILMGNTGVSIVHSLGRIVKVNGVYGTDDEAVVFKITNQDINSFVVALQGGFAATADIPVEGTYE